MPHDLRVHLNFRMQPIHRHKLEHALQKVLDERAPGSEIDGGGTLLGDAAEPLSCDIEVVVASSPDEVLATVTGFMDRCGAARGSYAVLDGGENVGFGVTDGLGLYLNGTELPDEVYAASDVNELIDLLRERLGDDGDVVSYWQGPTETALYLYGPSADRMRELITDVLVTHPLAQRSRLVAIT